MLTRPRVVSGAVRLVLRVDAREDLRRCPGRVLYLAGRSDHVVPRRNPARIRRLRPDTELVSVAGRHFALFTSPMAAAAFVATFAWSAMGRA